MTTDSAVDLLLRSARAHALGDVLRRSALRWPRKTAIVYGEISRTYAQLDEAVSRTANALRERGVRNNDRVAILSHNNYAYAVVFLALARLGAISVPINFMLNADEVRFILEHSGAIGMVVERALTSVADEAIRATGRALRVQGVILEPGETTSDHWQNVEHWMAHSDSAPLDVCVGDDEPIQIMYTSGTESRPKGATLSSRNLIAQYLSCIIDGGMSSEDVIVHSMPLYHCAQLHCFLMPGIYLGATNIILPAPQPPAIFAAIERYNASSFFCPPTIWISLLRHAEFGARRVASLRKGYYGASIMPVEIVRELSARIPDMQLYNFYGQTEMSPVATVLAPQDQLRKLGSAGRPAINVETQVVDENDRPVPPGTVGEIVHRSPHAMLGYWNDPEKTAQVFRNGWFHSGDLGVLDEEGYLTVVDRKKDVIKSGGENVASREVEDVLYSHPAVAEAAVFGLPDPLWIEAVTAALVLRPEHQIHEAEMIRFCRERLAGYKTPKRIIVVDRLPKNASGKILKRELRSRFASSRVASP